MSGRFQRFRTDLTGSAGLRGRAIRSSLWTMIEFGGSQFFRLASNLVLTRLLFPEAFGLMALVSVVIVGLIMLSDTGVQPSIMQTTRADDRRFLNTAWTVQIIRGVLLWLMIFAIAPIASDFYQQPQLAQLLPAAAFSMVLESLSPTKLHLSARNMVRGRITLVQLTAQVIGILTMIALAAVMESVWALVIGGVIGTAVKVTLFYNVLPGERDRLGWDPTAWRELFHFGKWVLVGSIAGFLINQGDRMVLGKYLSAYDLGIYSIGFFLASVPIMLVRSINSSTIFPLARERDPAVSAHNFSVVRRARLLASGVMLAMTIGFMLAGPFLVRFLYDDRYLAAQSVLLLLALAQIPQVILSPYGWVAMARGATRDQMWLNCVQGVGQIGLMLLGLELFGLGAALMAPAAASLLALPLIWSVARRHGAWDPALDVGLAVLGTAGALIALWINADALVLIDAFQLK